MPAGNRGLNRFSGPPLPGAFPWGSRINASGLAAVRPPACPANAGLYYLATDTSGGTLYRSTGTAWVQSGGPVTTTLTGDVTGSGTGSFATTISSAAVTLAKIANASANSKLLGSGAAGSGASYSEITVGSGLTMTGTTLSATGGGTVTSVSVVTANGVSGSVATATTTPAITITLGDITPTSAIITTTDAATNATTTVLTVAHNSSGTPAAGFALDLDYALATTTTPSITAAAETISWVSATHASRKGRRVFFAWDTAGRECMRIEASGTAAMWSCLGAAASAQLASPDLATMATTFGFASGTPTLGAANFTGIVPVNYVMLRDEKTQNTNGGTFTSGAWRTRTLNTKSVDTGSICTLASNQFQLPAGTYRIRANAIGSGCDRHQTRLQNITDSTTTLVGTSDYAPVISATNIQNRSLVDGRFTIAGAKTFELQHQCQTTSTTFGFGIAANFTTEVFAEVELWKEAS